MPNIKRKKMRDRSLHERVLEGLESDDPTLYAELVELRAQSPQSYRKRIRKLVRSGTEPSEFSRYEPLPINDNYTPGDGSQGRDPNLNSRLEQANVEAVAHAEGRAETQRKVAEAEARQEEHRRQHAARQADNTAKSPDQVRREAIGADKKADTSILDGSIGDLKKALASGSLDSILDDLIAAEEAGAARKGALKALQERKG